MQLMNGAGASVASVNPMQGLPKSLTTAASQAPKVSAPTPAYSGPSINSIAHTAQQLGATYNYNPATAMHTVNGIHIPSTSTSPTGDAMGSVKMISTASGFPAAHIQTQPDGSVQVMPHAPANANGMVMGGGGKMLQGAPTPDAPSMPQHAPAPAYSQIPPGLGSGAAAYLSGGGGTAGLPMSQPTPQTAPPTTPPGAGSAGAAYLSGGGGTAGAQTTQAPMLNPYWQGVQQNGGLWQANLGNLSASAFKNQLANQYGVDPNAIQLNATGHAWIPFTALQDHAIAASQQPAAAGGAGAGALDTALGTAQSTLGAGGQGNYDPTVQGLLNALLTALQGQQQMNPYASQIAGLQQPQFNVDPNQLMQQAYQTENPVYQNQIAAADQKINDEMNRRGIYNSGLAQQAVDAQNATLNQNMDNAMMKDYNSLYSQAQGDYKNELQAFMDRVNALHDAGALGDTQFSQLVTALNDAMSRSTAQQSSDTTASNDAMMQALNQYKAQVDAAYKSGQLTDAQYKNAIDAWNAQVKALQAGGSTVGANGQIVPTVAEQNATEKANMDSFNQWFKTQQINDTTQQNAFKDWATQQGIAQKWQSLSDAEKKQAFTQWYDQQGLALKQNENSFNQWLKTSQLKTTQEQNGFKDWATKQGIAQKWSSLNEKAKQDAVKNYQAQEKIDQGNTKLNQGEQKIQAQISHWAKQDQAKSFEDALKQHTLREKIAHDNQMIQLAQQRVTDTQAQQAITGYHDQLTSLSNLFANGGVTADTVDPTAATKFGPSAQGMTYADEYSYLMANITNIIANSGNSSSGKGGK